MCFAQGHNAVTLKPVAFQSLVKRSTTEPMYSNLLIRQVFYHMMRNAGKGPLWIDFHIFSF